MKFILVLMSMLVMVSGQKGKGGLFGGFPGNSGLNGHGQNHDGEFPGIGNFPGNGLGNGGEFPGGGKGNGHGNGGGHGDGEDFPGGNGHGNGGGNGHGNGGDFPGGNGHGNGGGNGHGNGGGLPVPGPIVNPVGSSLANTFGKYLVLKTLLNQNDDDYDYDYVPVNARGPRFAGLCVTGPVLRTFAGRKLLCDFNGACPAGSSCQNGLCCHVPSGTLVRRRRP